MTTSKKKVLIIEPSGNLWGSERVLLDFLRSDVSSSWKIGICCPPNSQILSQLDPAIVTIYRTFIANLHVKHRIFRALAALNLARVVFTFKPQLLYVNQAGATKIALTVGNLFRIPVVTHVRLIEDVYYVEQLLKRGYSFTGICISKFILGLFSECRINEAQNISMLYDPYIPRFDWSAPIQQNHNSKIVCVGRLTQIKGQDLLIRAIAELKVGRSEVETVFVGSDPSGGCYERQLKELACALRIGDCVTWPGFHEDIFPMLQESAVLVCPSQKEPLGRVIFEAWDAGTVPLAWEGSGGSAEIIEASGGGVLYEKQTASSLATAIKNVLTMSPLERQAVVNKGRAWLRANCSVGSYAQAMIAVWDKTLNPDPQTSVGQSQEQISNSVVRGG